MIADPPQGTELEAETRQQQQIQPEHEVQRIMQRGRPNLDPHVLPACRLCCNKAETSSRNRGPSSRAHSCLRWRDSGFCLESGSLKFHTWDISVWSLGVNIRMVSHLLHAIGFSLTIAGPCILYQSPSSPLT